MKNLSLPQKNEMLQKPSDKKKNLILQENAQIHTKNPNPTQRLMQISPKKFHTQ